MAAQPWFHMTRLRWLVSGARFANAGYTETVVHCKHGGQVSHTLAHQAKAQVQRLGARLAETAILREMALN